MNFKCDLFPKIETRKNVKHRDPLTTESSPENFGPDEGEIFVMFEKTNIFQTKANRRPIIALTKLRPEVWGQKFGVRRLKITYFLVKFFKRELCILDHEHQ